MSIFLIMQINVIFFWLHWLNLSSIPILVFADGFAECVVIQSLTMYNLCNNVILAIFALTFEKVIIRRVFFFIVFINVHSRIRAVRHGGVAGG